MRVLSFNQLRSEKGIPYSRVHIGRLEGEGKFPVRFALAGGARIVWAEDEIDAWLEKCAASRKHSTPPERRTAQIV